MDDLVDVDARGRPAARTGDPKRDCRGVVRIGGVPRRREVWGDGGLRRLNRPLRSVRKALFVDPGDIGIEQLKAACGTPGGRIPPGWAGYRSVTPHYVAAIAVVVDQRREASRIDHPRG